MKRTSPSRGPSKACADPCARSPVPTSRACRIEFGAMMLADETCRARLVPHQDVIELPMTASRSADCIAQGVDYLGLAT